MTWRLWLKMHKKMPACLTNPRKANHAQVVEIFKAAM